jgi:hypothetical protein
MKSVAATKSEVGAAADPIKSTCSPRAADAIVAQATDYSGFRLFNGFLCERRISHLTIIGGTTPTEGREYCSQGSRRLVVDETSICLADKATDRLYYRGCAIEDLAQHAAYEEVAYLLLNGELPSAVVD